MASTYTTRTRLEKQGDGENANTWGLKLNQNVIDLVDDAVAGYETIDIDAVTSISLTANDGTSDQARNFGLRFTGALTAPCTVVAPNAEKIYFVGNETTGNQPVVLKAGSASETVYPNSPALVAFDGTNSMQLTGFATGTRIPFENNTAPVGWTAVTDSAHNGAALRVVNAAVSGAQTGGSSEFNSVFNSGVTVSITGQLTESATLTGLTSAIALSKAQLPILTGQFDLLNRGGAGGSNAIVRSPSGIFSTENAGTSYGVGWQGEGGSQSTEVKISVGSSATHTHSLEDKGAHSHTVSVAQDNAFNLDVKYINFIVCEKD